MDSLISAAARALSAGDALGALKRVALREDPPALALRGIAMAQLGEHARARELLQRAARAFGPHEEAARARCVVADAEIALAVRDLAETHRLEQAIRTLLSRGDKRNAAHARLIAIRRLLLIGRGDEARSALARLEMSHLPPALVAIAELVAAGIALRSTRTLPAREALLRAQRAAERAGIPALLAEVAQARRTLDQPAARQISAGQERVLRLAEVEALFAAGGLIVDAYRREVRQGDSRVSLARRPVLFALARALGEGISTRELLIARAFEVRHINVSHRARLRVEIGRLRALLRPFARIEATPAGFRLQSAVPVSVLLPPIEGEQASLLALLSDGEAWSTSSLALALGESQRTVQRALAALEASGQVHAIGRARARRWLSRSPVGFATVLLLPAALPTG